MSDTRCDLCKQSGAPAIADNLRCVHTEYGSELTAQEKVIEMAVQLFKLDKSLEDFRCDHDPREQCGCESLAYKKYVDGRKAFLGEIGK